MTRAAEIPFVTDELLAELKKGDLVEVVFDCAPCKERVELTYVAQVRWSRGAPSPIVRHGNQYLPLCSRDRARIMDAKR